MSEVGNTIFRASICAAVDIQGELEAAEAWARKWRSALTHFDDSHGCGCCVVIYHVAGPRTALDEIPEDILSHDPDWSTYERESELD